MAEINITNAKTAWVNPLIYSIILIVAGVAMVIFKSEALRWILIAAGIMAVIGNSIELVILVKKKIPPVVPIIGIRHRPPMSGDLPFRFRVKQHHFDTVRHGN